MQPKPQSLQSHHSTPPANVAIEEYQTAARSEPNLWEAHFNLGLAYAQMAGREADAIAEYQTALRMKPDSALAHFHLGNTFHKQGRLPDAIR